MNNIYFLFLTDLSSNSMILEKPKKNRSKFTKTRKRIMEELNKIDLYHGESIDIKIDEEKLCCTAFRNSGDLLLCTFYNPTVVKSYVARKMLKDIIKKVSSLSKNYGVCLIYTIWLGFGVLDISLGCIRDVL